MLKNIINFYLDDINIFPINLYEEVITCLPETVICSLDDNESLIIPKYFPDTKKIKLYLKSSIKNNNVVDIFETYNNTGDLKNVWKTNSNFVSLELVSLETKMMKIQLTKSTSKDSMIYRSYFPTIDWTNFDGVKFKWFQSDFGSNFNFYIYDGKVKLVKNIEPKNEQNFEDIFLFFSEFSQIGTGNFNFATIKEIGFTVLRSIENTYVYVDDIYLFPKSDFITTYVGNYDIDNNSFTKIKSNTNKINLAWNIIEIDTSDINNWDWNYIKIFKNPSNLFRCDFYGSSEESNSIFKIDSNNTLSQISGKIYSGCLIYKNIVRISRIVLYPDTEFNGDIIKIYKYDFTISTFQILFYNPAFGREIVIDINDVCMNGRIFLEILRKSNIKQITAIIEFEEGVIY